jgi:tetratricopeptide (TPR) repeat protein
VFLGGLTFLGTAIGSAFSDTIKDVVKEGLGAFTAGQRACAVREMLTRNFGTPPPRLDPERFRVLVARLHDDDGKFSRQVARAFIGERGFSVVTTCRAVDLDGEDITFAFVDAVRQAEALRARRGADLIVWGQVADRGSGAVKLWFTAATVRPDGTRTPWKFELGTLGDEFRKEFALAFQTMAMAAVVRAGDVYGWNAPTLLLPRLPPLRSLVAHPPAGLPQEDRNALRRSLADALRIIGDQTEDDTSLHEACEQYRHLLRELPREQAPLAWADAQNDLGHALLSLGEREAGTARLEEAVDAYRAALEEATRGRAPLQWAATQNGLGNALWALGGREAGTARLEEAVDAHRAALEEATRGRAPFDWAWTQSNLGAALAALGGREAGTARLEEAVDAHRAALEEMTRGRAPLAWAWTQSNLGNALAALGAREAGTARLEEAVAAHRAALEERTRGRAPYLWARTMENLAIAEMAWGDKAGEPARWRAALQHCEAALEEYRRAGATYDIGTATSLRDELRTKLGLP